MSKEDRLSYGNKLRKRLHTERMKRECKNMDALAITITGTSPYPDSFHYEDGTFYLTFTGQFTKQDDHFVYEAFARGIPIHVFHRHSSADCYTYCGESTSHGITSDITDDLMEGYVFCPDGGLICGTAVVPGSASRFIKKNGALAVLNGLEVIDQSKVPRCFIPLKFKNN